MGIHRVTIWVIGVLTYLLSPPDPPSKHDPQYLTLWELWYYSILRSCRIFGINSTESQGSGF